MSFFDVDGISKRNFAFLLVLKLGFGVLLWAIYTFYYTERATADIYKYFDDSEVIYYALKTNPIEYFKLLTGIGNNTPAFDHYYADMHYWARKVDSSIYNDSHTIIRFNALVRVFSCGYYNVHTAFACFLSLIGLTAIYKTFVPYLQTQKRELFFAVFLLPSVLFWGSGVLKESIIFFALGLLIYYTSKLFSLKAILVCLLTAALLAFSKFYVWLAVLPGLVLFIWTSKSAYKNVAVKFLMILFLFGSIGLNIDKFTPLQNPLVTLSQKQFEFGLLANGQMTDSNNKPIPVANSSIVINTLEPTFLSFLRNSPQALANTFLRPFLWESRSPLIFLSSLETYFILFTILISLLFIRSTKEIKWTCVLFCLSFVIFQFLIIGETTPVLGAITRYRTIALPFLLIGFLFIIDKEKLVKKFPFVRKLIG